MRVLRVLLALVAYGALVVGLAWASVRFEMAERS